ncbi:EAL domain-containing protein [Motiliproteus coralliicola]|uniref:cyclic-guanylate-specific phosphodiesterase n=1 Tax=Motiliproteus coralliicola TaxID=2283196 RepID=A0A369WTF6_9GAMM|nr:EAL domain-containing protein [Motiliproteus coralliicola]RDE24957.1 EAL domain-containing protein [Motiliproteus coralliicola]
MNTTIDLQLQELPISLERLEQICLQVSDLVNCEISIMAGSDGVIVASSLPNRAGIQHPGAARILRSELDVLDIDKGLAAQSEVMLEGCNLGVDFDQQRLLCVGVAAPLELARQFAAVVKACIEAMLKSEFDHQQVTRVLNAEISERIQAQKALRESEIRFREFADIAAHWLWEMDADLRFSYFSAPLKTYLGVNPDSLIGKTRWDLMGENGSSESWKAHQQVLQRREPFRDFEYDANLPNGEVRVFRISGNPIFDATDRFLGYRGVGLDVTEEVQSHREARLLRQRLEDSLEAITEGFLVFDSQHRLLMCNSAYRNSAKGVAHLLQPGLHIKELNRALIESGLIQVPKAQWGHWLQERWERFLRCDRQLTYPTRDGQWIEVDQYRTQDGGTLIIRRDITERVRNEERLRLAATVFENTQEGIIIADPSQAIVAVNPAFVSLTGYTESDVLGKTPRILSSGRHDKAFYDELKHCLIRDGYWSGEIWNKRKSGEVFPEWLSITQVHDETGQLLNYVAVFSDISVVKESEQRLEYLAHHDPLTELPNRLLFMAKLDQALKRIKREHHAVAVMFLDLDHFKHVNDSLGHAAGDRLLVDVAKRLREGLREQDTIARIGGDEFTVLAEDLDDRYAVDQVVSKILAQFEEPFLLEGRWFHLSASVGISIAPENGTEGSTLLRNADTALYKVKEQGRNGYRYYSAEFTRQAQQRIELEQQLREAIKQQQFVIYYQPQVRLDNCQIIGAEALVRWEHPQRGRLAPNEFIPLAEQTGLICKLGQWVLNEACRQMQTWLGAGYRLETMSVNFSKRQLTEGNFVEQVNQALRSSNLPASFLEMEIVESLIMEQSDEVMAALDELRLMGVSLAIDDFGTGYSSLAYLKQLPVGTLKIDRSFVRDIPDDPSDCAIVKAIMALADSLQLEVVAEGVETAEQATFLSDILCPKAQGYYYRPPISAQAFEALLRNSHSDGVARIIDQDIDYQI